MNRLATRAEVVILRVFNREILVRSNLHRKASLKSNSKSLFEVHFDLKIKRKI